MAYTKTLTVDEVIRALQALSSAGYGDAKVITASFCCESEAGFVEIPDGNYAIKRVLIRCAEHIPDNN